jgi:hypothetical protein
MQVKSSKGTIFPAVRQKPLLARGTLQTGAAEL